VKKTAPEPRVPLMQGSSPKCGAARATRGTAGLAHIPPGASAPLFAPHFRGQSLQMYSMPESSLFVTLVDMQNDKKQPFCNKDYSSDLSNMQEIDINVKKYMIFRIFVIK